MKYISLLGATGSIGQQTIDVVRNHPEQFRIVAFSAGKNIPLVRTYINEFKPELVSVQTKEDYETLKSEYQNVTFMYGAEGLVEVAVYHKASILVNAVMGSVGFFQHYKLLRQKKILQLQIKKRL